MAWTPQEAERYLDSLEPLGMRFGLERIHRLLDLLGMPQRSFASIHVVGTNGKSSVTEATAALLEAHGIRAGAYLSPHGTRWAERVRIGGGEIEPGAFAVAVERVGQAVAPVNRTLAEGEEVTQFEAATAAAFVALAAARVEVAVVEAGLGGRLDATNVLPSRAAVLTSVGLDHTQWLGETRLEIAAEKLAVLRPHTTLVTGALDPEVAALAEETARERHARLVAVRDLSPAVVLSSPAPYARRNFAVALAAADVIVDALDPRVVAEVAAGLELRGRAELVEGDPPLILDAAHNPAGAVALAEALGEFAGERPVIACTAVLVDKDAAGILAALEPHLAAVVTTEIPAERLARAGRPGARALPAAELEEAARAAGIEVTEAVADPAAALARAETLAREHAGVALVCGSHYLLEYVSRR